MNAHIIKNYVRTLSSQRSPEELLVIIRRKYSKSRLQLQ